MPNPQLWPILLVGGQRKAELEALLVSLLVEETWEGLYRCEATFDNWSDDGLRFDDRSTLEFGKPFVVKMGDENGAVAIFDGKIMGLEGLFPRDTAPMLTVLAEDRLQDLRMNRHTRSFEKISDSAVISQVISDAGLSASVSVQGFEQHEVIVQMNQSDLAFIRERARAVDAEVWAEGSTVHVGARSSRAAGEVTLTYAEDLLEFSVLADLAGQRSEVHATGWDVTTKEAITVTAAASAISSELGSLTGGSAVLESALGARLEQVVHHQPAAQGEAKFLAEATYRRLARRFLTGVGQAEGTPALKVGCKVTLKGLGALFSGAYYVTEVRHMVDRNLGYRTQFRVERPGIGG